MNVETNNYYYSGDWLRNVHWPKHNYTQRGITTENWIGSPGWIQFGSAKRHRSIQDFTYSIAQYVAYGATMHNIYMMYGSTSYGRVEHTVMHFHMGYIILRVKCHHR